MVRFLLLIFLLNLANFAHGQQEEKKVFFTEALAMHLPKYESKAKEAYRLKNYNEAQRLFDSLVKFGLNGSYMDDFKFNQLNGKQIRLYDFKKPVYFITYASWCVTSKGEIPALNKLAEEYHKEIDFVILFWDDRETTKKAAKKYNEYIQILYVNEMDNKDAFVISHLKHSLGLPTTFLLNSSKKIQDVRRGITHPYGKSLKDSFDMNYNKIFEGIANHLLGEKYFESQNGPVALN